MALEDISIMEHVFGCNCRVEITEIGHLNVLQCLLHRWKVKVEDIKE